VHAFDVLGDPVRRRILELLAAGERPAGDVSAVVQIDAWLDRYRRFRAQPLDALATELARGRRERRNG
jgi:DNA-binding transcriptional ArsR family regulator